MSNLQELICITCPKGCVTKVWKENGDIKIEGMICKKGKDYIKQEYIEPKRILTSTVVVEHSAVKRLPVRTREAIPKEKLFMAMNQLSEIRVKPPVKISDVISDVIISNLLNTGIDVIASDDLL
jgi:CxxC motif-containing protein